jgi:hypothetical protein
MANEYYFEYPAKFGSTMLDGVPIGSVQLVDGITIVRPLTDGDIDPKCSYKTASMPGLTYGTYNIADGLDLFITGSVASAITGAVTVWDAQVSHTGARQASSSVKYYMATAVSYPVSLAAAIAQDASALAQLSIASMAYGSELVTSTSQSHDSFTASKKGYRLAKIVVNGTEMVNLVRADVQFGLTVTPQPKEQTVTGSLPHVTQRMPAITVVTSNSAQKTSFVGSGGAGVKALNGTTGAILYFQKFDPNAGGLVSAASAVHVAITMLDGSIRATGTSGAIRNTAYEILPEKATGGNIMTINTATTIP